VVHHRADAAQLLAAAGAAGSAVDQVRHGRTMPGGAAGVLTVEHQDTAVVGSDAGHQFAGN
jgi:hypothetical protein